MEATNAELNERISNLEKLHYYGFYVAIGIVLYVLIKK